MPTSGIFAPYFSPRSPEDLPSLPHARGSADIEAEEMPSYPMFASPDSEQNSYHDSGFKAIYMPQLREEPNPSHPGSFLFKELSQTVSHDIDFKKIQRGLELHEADDAISRAEGQNAPTIKASSFSHRQDFRHLGNGSQYKLSLEVFPRLPAPSLHPAGLKPTTLDKV